MHPTPAELDQAIRDTFGNTYQLAHAIMLAESGGNCQAISPTNDYGCFQINAPSHPQWSTAQLLDYKTNIQAAFTVSNGGTNWTPWTTFTSGKYLQYL